MKIISHRGNLKGPDKSLENNPTAIQNALDQGFDAELDLWVLDNNKLFLGHSVPRYKITPEFLSKPGLWIHCKNKQALEYVSNLVPRPNYFYHQVDTYTITSHGYTWSYVGAEVIKNAVCVMPSLEQDLTGVFAVCTDYPTHYASTNDQK